MINLALIGVGRWGKNFISTISSIPDCRLKYICAHTNENLKTFSDDYTKVRNYRDLFKYKDIDGLIVVTPGSTHFEIAYEFLKKGYNLFIEKPLTTDYKQALKLKKVYDSKKSAVLVGHIDLYNPPFIKLKKITKDIGQIQYLTFEGLNNGPVRSDMSVLWEWGPHGIAVVLDLLKIKPEKVAAWAINSLKPKGNLNDMVLIQLRFPNKAVAIIKVGWLSPIKKRELVVVGSKSTVVYDNLADKKVAYFENISPLRIGDNFIKREPQVSHPSVSGEAPLKLEILEFIKAIKQQRRVRISDLDFGVEVIELLHLAEQSIKNDGKVIVNF